MTADEVRAEVARILAPYIREEFERRRKGKKKGRKRKKPAQDGHEPSGKKD
jgi:hypothetical protein